MESRRPSGYCGANIVSFQSGIRYAGRSSSAATTSRPRGPRPMGAARSWLARSKTGFMDSPRTGLPALPLPLDDEVTLHLLVESRAEIRAVVGEDAGLVRLEGDGLGLPRVHDDVDVVVEQAEPVELAGRLLDVRHRDLDGVPQAGLDP